MRSLGRSATEFKKGMNEIDDDLRDEQPARTGASADESSSRAPAEEKHGDEPPAG